jgi:hypothetical protein
MVRKFIILIAVLITILSISTSSTPHTYHNVSANGYAVCQFAHLYEMNFYFVDTSNNEPINKFTLNPNTTQGYGLVITERSNFNMLYALTCTQDNNLTAQSPKVAFVIGADGPAQPNINVINYYGAKGTFQIIVGVGEDYQVYFPYY